MIRHLSPEEIRLLSRYELTGTAFAAALTHIERCDRCRKLLPRPGTAEIIERLLLGNLPPEEQTKPIALPPGKQIKRKWVKWLKGLKQFLFKKDKR